MKWDYFRKKPCQTVRMGIRVGSTENDECAIENKRARWIATAESVTVANVMADDGCHVMTLTIA